MSDSNRPIIIKRKVIAANDTHHSGAWKVAYADFVTAMMAFFLLMWLLSATTERQRKGLSDYFSPSIAMSEISSGGDGVLYGEESTQNAAAASSDVSGNINLTAPQLRQINEEISGVLKELEASEPLLSQIISQVQTRPSDEGFVIELYDILGASVFENNSAILSAGTLRLLTELVQVLENADKNIAINGHIRAIPIAFNQEPAWELTSARAQSVQKALILAGFPPHKVKRVSGHADRSPIESNPNSIRNNRIEIILLR